MLCESVDLDFGQIYPLSYYELITYQNYGIILLVYGEKTKNLVRPLLSQFYEELSSKKIKYIFSNFDNHF